MPLNIQSQQVRVYRHDDVNDVAMYGETHHPDQVMLIAIDPLTITRNWPDHAQVNGRWYKRDLQFATPATLAGQVYGMRRYVALPQVPALSKDPLILREASPCR